MQNRKNKWAIGLSVLLLLQVEALVIIFLGIWIGDYLVGFLEETSKISSTITKAAALLLSLLIVFYVWIKTFLVVFKK